MIPAMLSTVIGMAVVVGKLLVCCHCVQRHSSLHTRTGVLHLASAFVSDIVSPNGYGQLRRKERIVWDQVELEYVLVRGRCRGS